MKFRSALRILGVGLLTLTLPPSNSHALSFFGKLEPADETQASVAEAQSKIVQVGERLPIEKLKLENSEEESDLWGITIEGNVIGKPATQLNGKRLAIDPKTGGFSETIPYSAAEPVLVKLITDGKEVTYRVRLLDPDEGPRGAALGFDARGGYVYSSFSQDLKADSSQMGLFARAAYRRKLPLRRTQAIAEGYITALPFGSSREESARYYGISVRAAYTYPLTLSPWSVQAGLGYYLNGMLVTEDEFGFARMNGFFVQPAVIRELKDGSQFSGALRLGTTMPGFGLGEVTASGLYRLPAKTDGFHWLAGFDVTSIRLSGDGNLSTVFVTLTGGAGF